MKILKTMGAFEGEGKLFSIDTIEHDGKIWLVPEWLDSQTKDWTMPARIIWLAPLQHQSTPGSPFGDFVLNSPISRDIFEGRIQPPKGSHYVVIERPNIRIPLPPSGAVH